MGSEMTAEKLLQIYKDLKALDATVILDGGWGIDALLGKQTRPHKDIDFLTEKKDVEKVRKYFVEKGYKPSKTEPATDFHFVLESPDGIADIHVIKLDSEGNGQYGPKEMNASFPSYGLKGSGQVNGMSVRTLTPEYRIEALTKAFGVVVRTGYILSEKDYRDLSALSKRFSIPMPQEYLDDMAARGIKV